MTTQPAPCWLIDFGGRMNWLNIAWQATANLAIASVMASALADQSVPAALVAIGMVMWKRGV